MRILFSAVPAFGHFLPFASLVHAAGPGVVELLTEVERRTGGTNTLSVPRPGVGSGVGLRRHASLHRPGTDAEAGTGVADVLADNRYRQNAQAVAKQVADMPSPEAVLARIADAS